MSMQNLELEVFICWLDCIFVFIVFGIVVVVVLCFFVIIIGMVLGMDQVVFGEGVWFFIVVVLYWGFFLVFVMIIVLLIMSFIWKGCVFLWF